jgi:hypothetical protein
MFTIECPTHDSRVLVTETRIRDLRNLQGKILLDVECWCGTHVTIRTGRQVIGAFTRTSAPARA